MVQQAGIKTEKVWNEHFSLWLFVFTSSITCGIVFFGALVGMGYMLSERGFTVTNISGILLGSLPYSFKFIISPIVKNAIARQKDKCLYIKRTSIVLQIIMFIGMSFCGGYTKESYSVIIFLNLFLVTLASSINDLFADYIRLRYFTGKRICVITSVGTIGFKVGMLLSSVCVLYMANYYGWHNAFIFVACFIICNTISSILLRFNDTRDDNVKHITTIKQYFTFYKQLMAKYGAISIVLLILLFKISDSCINGLKSVFLHQLGIDKISFANISQFTGIIIMVIMGAVSSICVYKFGTKKCVYISFLCEICACLCFLILSLVKTSIIELFILINISTFFLSFSSMIYRTYISEIADGDINSYTVLISMGSLFRSFASYMGGIIIDHFSWSVLYAVCCIFTIICSIAIIKGKIKCIC